ncbi:MAG: cysteine--tRNA ligase [Chloroflexi bacterium]|nr:cysteine--tRNA ligase [Chloroflexota bacterium]
MKIYSTLSGQKEEFLPAGSEVKMYVCGVTPYSDAHIGHAMSYVTFDVIRRYLKFRGYKVKYVQNITDIDDKIIDRANRLGIPTDKLVEQFVNSYFEDMDALNILRADVYPRATGEVDKIIEIIEGLIAKGFAYPSQGSVYFRVKNVPDYGKLSHRSLESMMTGESGVGGEDKENPMDFVLWKAAKPGEPSWKSPWGDGRPGWHIECTAMSIKYLGETIDVHGGGQDLVFPHHENEIAQSESFTGKKPFVKYWLHNGLVRLGEEKMSKSLGNLVTIKETLAKHSADALRVFILSSYYRSPLSYSEEALEAAEKGAERLRQSASSTVEDGKTDKGADIESYRNRFIEAMDDDFNTPQAVATLFDLARDINRLRDEGYQVTEGTILLSELAGILGLTLKAPEKPSLESEPFIELLVTTRSQLRQAKQFQLADMIRTRLEELGITLEDTPKETRWERKRE